MADEPEDDDDSPLTVGDFHMIAQKQIMNAVFATLAESKMQWNLVEPFLETARAVCAGDFVENARIRIHTQRAEGEDWVDAEEAFLGISVADREDGEECLAETYWLSGRATADRDRGAAQLPGQGRIDRLGGGDQSGRFRLAELGVAHPGRAGVEHAWLLGRHLVRPDVLHGLGHVWSHGGDRESESGAAEAEQ